MRLAIQVGVEIDKFKMFDHVGAMGVEDGVESCGKATKVGQKFSKK